MDYESNFQEITLKISWRKQRDSTQVKMLSIRRSNYSSEFLGSKYFTPAGANTSQKQRHQLEIIYTQWFLFLLRKKNLINLFGNKVVMLQNQFSLNLTSYLFVFLMYGDTDNPDFFFQKMLEKKYLRTTALSTTWSKNNSHTRE